jgi:hypothetical protein
VRTPRWYVNLIRGRGEPGGGPLPARLEDRAFCRGAGGSGQIGDGKTLTRPTLRAVAGGLDFRQMAEPVAVAGGLHFGGVSPGGDHTCGTSAGDLAYCWGYNYYGQSGDGGPLGTAASNHLPLMLVRISS